MIARALTWLRWLVPRADREAWRREWLAEFAAAERDRARAGLPSSRSWRLERLRAASRHALWLRWQAWRPGGLGRDVRHGLRALRRRPAFTVAAVCTLAIGVAGSTVIYSAVRAVLWRPLPYPDPGRLAMVSYVNGTGPEAAPYSASAPDFLDWRQQSHTFTGMAAIRDDSPAVTGDGPAEQLVGHSVTGDFFGVLGVPAALGRVLGPDDDAAGGPAVVVLSDALWRRRYRADPSVIGRRVLLDGASVEVVGVMPASFDYPIGSDIWMPLRFSAADLTGQRGARYLTVVARRRASVSDADASAEMAAIGRHLAATYAKTALSDVRVTVVPLRDGLLGASVAPAMAVLVGAVGLLFLVACVNVASLVMGAAMARDRDLAVRTALGASRRDLARGLFVESLLLAGVGSLAGTAIAAAGVRAVAAMSSVGIPLLDQTRVDRSVMLFTLAVTAAAAVLFGVLPALQASRTGGGVIGSEGTRTTAGRQASRARDLLVMGEIAMAVALLVGAGLLARSFLALTRVPLGLDPDRVQTASISLPDAAYADPARVGQFLDDVLARLKARGDVASAAAIFGLPLTDLSYYINLYDRDGQSMTTGKRVYVELRTVTPGYFATMGIPTREGRDFSVGDRQGSAPVVIVNRAAASLIWPGADALGHRLGIATRFRRVGTRLGGEVVGVVGDVRDEGPERAPRPTVYFCESQVPFGFLTLVVKAVGSPADLPRAIRAAVAATDPDVPVYDVRTMDDVAGREIAQPRFYLLLVGLFATVAILLAGIGVYGVMAQHVGARMKEIGIRVALGASPRAAVALVLRHACRLAVAGLGAGVGIAMLARRAVAGLLFGVEPFDLPTLAAVTLLVGAAALLAAWVPARRAAHVDPVTTLRAT